MLTSYHLTPLDTVGGKDSTPNGLNAYGQVFGTWHNPGGQEHAFLWTPTSQNGWSSGTLTDLPPLQPGESAGASGINAFGQVVGSSTVNGFSATNGFLWTPNPFPHGTNGQITNLLTLNNGLLSGATGINDFGQVVGGSVPSGSYVDNAFLWQPNGQNATNGTMYAVPNLSGTLSVANFINSCGDAVGYSDSSSGAEVTFLWRPNTCHTDPTQGGTLYTVPPLPGDNSIRPVGLNDAEEVVANSVNYSTGYSQALVWPLGAPVKVPPIGTDPSDYAYAINASGDVVGKSIPASQNPVAFFWKRTSNLTYNVGILSGGTYSVAEAINATDVVVGYSSINAPGTTDAFVWKPNGNSGTGQLGDLNTQIPGGTGGWTLTEARGINDFGQIVCTGVNAQGVVQAFLLTPYGKQAVALSLPASWIVPASASGAAPLAGSEAPEGSGPLFGIQEVQVSAEAPQLVPQTQVAAISPADASAVGPAHATPRLAMDALFAASPNDRDQSEPLEEWGDASLDGLALSWLRASGPNAGP